MPAHIYDAAHAARVLNHHGGVVFDRVVMHNVRALSDSAQRLAEEKIQNVDAMRCDVEQRAATGLGRVDEPTAAAGAVEPSMTGEFGEHGLADCARCQQLLRTLYFGIAASIVRDPKHLAAL